jgi:hypothetical protein
VDKSDKRKANIHLTEIMIAAQEMMERAETRRDVVSHILEERKGDNG